LALAYSESGQGGRPPFDPVMMFKILVIGQERAHFLTHRKIP
jgi:hypothetical protein